MFAYAGIGSRETPIEVCDRMYWLGEELAREGWLLRSGHAGGADMAFESGARVVHGAKMEIFIPWDGFNGAVSHDPAFIIPQFSNELMGLAAKHHPAWERCGQGARKLHARNGCQILGSTLNQPVSMVICWTVGAKGGGGTGQALRIARSKGIPIFDLADPATWDRLAEFVNALSQPANAA